MSISLAGPSQAQTDCIHHWDIVGSHDVIPKSITPENPEGRQYGGRTPGICRNCHQERMFSSSLAQFKKEDFTLEGEAVPE